MESQLLIEHGEPQSHFIADKAFVSHKFLIKNSTSNVFSAKFSGDGNYLAASYADGSVAIHTTFKGDRVFQPKIEAKEEDMSPSERRLGKKTYMMPAVVVKPIVSSICWRPSQLDDNPFQNFKVVTTDGRIASWRPEKAHALTTERTSDTNYYHSLDFSPDEGSKLVCAGKLPLIEVYDDETMKQIKGKIE